MKRNKLIPSDDVYTYHKQAYDMLDKSHPHYEEIEKHLLAQIRDELSDRYNTRPDSRTDGTGEITDFSRAEEVA